ncbi:hypothetical protein [Rudanella paleaurantiibacter]|uniref:hypothetical protein n=1 Tax=Rudanella paleaurantiibacter TaxID=2614655 RepID=UPI0016287E96|nr:hypothetical protein [Rudanella paleaurantiibacter]
MAKLKKYPKALKGNPSLEALQKQKAKVVEIKKHNDSILRAEAAKKKLKDEILKMKKK